jgi:hypothetical protein
MLPIAADEGEHPGHARGDSLAECLLVISELMGTRSGPCRALRQRSTRRE